MGQTASAMSYHSDRVYAYDNRQRDRDNNNNLKEENIQEIIEIGAYQEDYKPLIILNNNIDSKMQAKLNILLL